VATKVLSLFASVSETIHFSFVFVNRHFRKQQWHCNALLVMATKSNDRCPPKPPKLAMVSTITCSAEFTSIENERISVTGSLGILSSPTLLEK